MNNHKIIMVGAPYCPLCDKRMREIFVNKGATTRFAPHEGKKVYICSELDCMVSISVKDPCIEKWRETTAPKCNTLLPGEGCGKPVKMFFRSDGFVKMVCKNKSHHHPYSIMRGDPKYMGPV